jgi:hypothetical protein
MQFPVGGAVSSTRSVLSVAASGASNAATSPIRVSTGGVLSKPNPISHRMPQVSPSAIEYETKPRCKRRMDNTYVKGRKCERGTGPVVKTSPRGCCYTYLDLGLGLVDADATEPRAGGSLHPEADTLRTRGIWIVLGNMNRICNDVPMMAISGRSGRAVNTPGWAGLSAVAFQRRSFCRVVRGLKLPSWRPHPNRDRRRFEQYPALLQWSLRFLAGLAEGGHLRPRIRRREGCRGSMRDCRYPPRRPFVPA